MGENDNLEKTFNDLEKAFGNLLVIETWLEDDEDLEDDYEVAYHLISSVYREFAARYGFLTQY